MKKTKIQRNLVLKQLLSGMLASVLMAALAFGLTTLATAKELDKAIQLTTDYDTVKTLVEDNSKPASTSKNYVKANYKVEYSDCYKENLEAIYPSPEHVSASQAAEIAAQEIWKIYGISMEGKTILVTLYPNHGTLSSRPEWSCVIVNDNYKVETRKGTMLGGITVTLDGFDGSIGSTSILKEWQSKNLMAQEYEAAAKELVINLNLLNSPIKSIIYFDAHEDGIEFVPNTRTNFDNVKEIGGNVGVVAENGDIVMLTIAADDLSIIEVSYGIKAKRDYKLAEQ